jgi:hypothetical protein
MFWLIVRSVVLTLVAAKVLLLAGHLPVAGAGGEGLAIGVFISVAIGLLIGIGAALAVDTLWRWRDWSG